MNKLTGISALAVLSLAGTANAGWEVGDTIVLSRVSSSPARAVTVNFDFSRTSSASGVTGGNLALAGRNIFNIISHNDRSTGGQIAAFCVEINEGFPDDPITYTLTEPTDVPEEDPPGNMSANQSAMMQDLYARNYADVSDTSNDDSWSDSSDENAAFQLVIWEISHENFSSTDLDGMKAELNLTLGALVATDMSNNNVATIASSMIAGLGEGGWRTMSNLLGATNNSSGTPGVGNQDLLIVVPSPAIAALAGLGLVGMRRRRR